MKLLHSLLIAASLIIVSTGTAIACDNDLSQSDDLKASDISLTDNSGEGACELFEQLQVNGN